VGDGGRAAGGGGRVAVGIGLIGSKSCGQEVVAE
jgi:hypothetical protein